MTDVTLVPTDQDSITELVRFDVVVDGAVVGRLEKARQTSIEHHWQKPMSRARPAPVKWEASPIGKDDWYAFDTRKAAIEHILGGPVGRVSKGTP